MSGNVIRMETPAKTKTVCDVCQVLRDPISIRLFLNGVSRDGLSRKQYYSRVARLIECGLLVRKHGVHEMTSTGLIVKKALKLMEQAVKLNEMLRFYDVARHDTGINHSEIVHALFNGAENQELRGILLTEQRVSAGVEPVNKDMSRSSVKYTERLRRVLAPTENNNQNNSGETHYN